MEVDDSQFIIQMNRQVTVNKEQGLPADTNISDERFQRFVKILRGNRASASSVKTGGGPTRKKVDPMDDADILDLFKN